VVEVHSWYAHRKYHLIHYIIRQDVQVREVDKCGWVRFKTAKEALKAKKLVTQVGTNRVKVNSLNQLID
jgi:hypothetical protein